MKDFLENFFNGFSKIVFFIPLVLIGVALLVRFNNYPKQTPTLSKIVPTQLISPSPRLTFDLTGPLSCDVSLATASARLFVKNKNVKAVISKKDMTSYFLLNGDCFYEWTDKTFSGGKTCGLAPFVQTVSLLPIDIATVLSFIPNSRFAELGILNPKTIDTDKILQTCKKEPIENAVFNIPPAVLFKNKAK